MGRLNGMTADAVAARLPEVLETVQISERQDQIIGTLSHGYRKRVGIAQAIIHDPRLVILDEPISGLDPVQIVGMRDVIRDLARNRAVMVSSHILSEIEQTCDRIIVLRDGQLIAQGTEEELTSNMGRARISFTLRDEQGRLDAWLQERPEIIDIANTTRHADHQVDVTVTLAEDTREALAADIISAGFGLRRMEAASDALESIFLGLTHTGEA
jgi:ABC-2 type transport system ATP-binding protein